MSPSIDRPQMRHRRAIQRRYDADQKRMALLISLLLLQWSQWQADGQRSLPTDTRTRLLLKAAIWAQVLRPYYIGQGTEPFAGAAPQSPFAQLVADGVEGAMRLQVRRSIAMLKLYVRDPVVLGWFLTPLQVITLPEVRQESYQQPFYAYTDPNGYKLNDRILRNAIDTRAKIDRMLDYHIAAGDSAEAIGGVLLNYMTIQGRMTRKPYGDYGSYAPWKMLRGEMLVGVGRATVIASLLNPVVDMVQWRLSPGHKDTDQCDENAAGGRNGDGVYPVNAAPMFPDHTQCRCSLWPIAGDDIAAGVNLRDAIMERNASAQPWRGSLNEYSLLRALVNEPVMELA